MTDSRRRLKLYRHRSVRNPLRTTGLMVNRLSHPDDHAPTIFRFCATLYRSNPRFAGAKTPSCDSTSYACCLRPATSWSRTSCLRPWSLELPVSPAQRGKGDPGPEPQAPRHRPGADLQQPRCRLCDVPGVCSFGCGHADFSWDG